MLDSSEVRVGCSGSTYVLAPLGVNKVESVLVAVRVGLSS